MKFIIDESANGKTVLTYLKSIVKISSGTISHLKTLPDGICVNGSRVTVRYVLSRGDILSINSDDTDNQNEHIAPVNLPFEIVYEDDNILVVNKPTNMPTHPSHNHHYDTLGNAIAYLYSTRNVPFVFRPTGRLDRNTSGLVMLPKSRASASFFSAESKSGRIEKHYIAVLEGEISAEYGKVYSIEAPIKRCGDSIITRKVTTMDDPDADYALTNWKLIYSGNGISIVDAYPITGRTHQIRVHFASIGYPLVGDSFYGDTRYGFDCHLLHAVSLKFKKCFSEEYLHISATPNDIMADFVLKKTGRELEEIIKNYDFSIPLSPE